MKIPKLTPSVALVTRLLLVCVVWGLGAFGFFSAGVWATRQAAEELRAFEKPDGPLVNLWLEQAGEPLARLARDPTLALGLAMPTGLESLPVIRLLNQMAATRLDPELYVVDTRTGMEAHNKTASPFPPDITTRLAATPGDVERVLVGMGRRSGLFYMAYRLESQPAVWAAQSITPAEVASHWPQSHLPEGTKTSLILAHSGSPAGVAVWSPETLAFAYSQEMMDAVGKKKTFYIQNHNMTVRAPLKGWDGTALAIEGPFGAMAWLGMVQLAAVLLTLGATALLVWQPSATIRKKVAEKLPAGVSAMGGAVGSGISGGMGKLGSMTAPLQGALKERVGKLRGAAQPPEGAPTEGAELPEPNTKKPEAGDTAGEFDAPARPKTAEEAPLPEPLEAPKPTNAPTLPTVEATPAPAPATEPTEPPAPAAKPKPRWRAPTPHEAPASTHHTPDAQALQALEEKRKPSPSMKAIIEQCIAQNRLELHYQPIYRVEDSMPVLHEVFLRLLGPDGELIMPGDFLPTATQFNLTLPLDLAVIHKIQSTFFVGQEVPPTPLALNISSSSLEGLDYLKEAVRLGPRILQRLALEVRSQEMVRDSRALKLLKEIQRHGGHLAVDYFGGGASMMAAAKTMNFDYVKIDADSILKQEHGTRELETLCLQASQIGIPVILEKVGDIATETLARRAGATYMQGFGLCKPKKALTVAPLPPRMSGLAALVNTAME